MAVLNVVGSQIVHRPFEVGYSLLFTIALLGSFPVMCSVWTYTCTRLKTCVLSHCTGSKQCDRTFKRYSLEQVSVYLLGGEELMVCCFLFQTGWDTTSSESESELEIRRRALLKQLGAAGDDH